MSEVQAHGNEYEELIIRQRTGLNKKEYDSLKKNGYTSELDLVKGIIVDYNASIKTTGSNLICCGDLIKKMQHKEYNLIVGCYRQEGNNKVFHTEYEFFIKPENYSLLWGDILYEEVERFVDFVKSIPSGKQGRQNSLQERNRMQKNIQSKHSLFVINPKVDSKSQRRVQCSLKINELINSGIKYTEKSIDITIQSNRRNNK